jgi:hypothetical protein
LANIKSAKKRIKVAAARTERNKAIKSKVKTAIKKVNSAVVAKDKELASTALHDAVVELTKATSKGVFHKNTSSRKISRLAKLVNTVE